MSPGSLGEMLIHGNFNGNPDTQTCCSENESDVVKLRKGARKRETDRKKEREKGREEIRG